MANFFDQFDPQPSAAPTQQPDGSNFFDQFDPPAPKPMSTTDQALDVAKGAGTGLASGVATAPFSVAALPKLGADAIVAGGDYLVRKTLGLGPASPETLANQQRAEKEAAFGVPDPAQAGAAVQQRVDQALPQPQTTAGQYAKTIGEFAPSAVAGPGGVVGKAASVVVPAVGSQALGDLAHDHAPSLEPYARAAGAVVGAVTGHAAGKGMTALGNTFEPVTAKGQTAIAARDFHNSMADPDAVGVKFAETPNETIPGFQPTTAQLTGDRGLLGAEKTMELQDPAFTARRAANEQALTDSLKAIQPGGSTEDLANGLRSHLQALDDAETANVTRATGQAQDAVSGLGGQEGPSFYGRQIQEGVQPQVDAARAAETSALGTMGGTGTPEQYGAAMRGEEQAGEAAAKAQRSSLYNAIDPDGKLNIVSTGPRQAATDLAKSVSPMAEQPAGKEASIIADMSKMPDVVPFKDLQALDSRITAAMSEERRAAGETPVLARLTQLKGSVMDAISNGVANQVAYERHGIATGQMAADAGMEARVRQWQDRFYAGQQEGARTGTIDGVGGNAGAGSTAFSGVSGAKGQGRGGPRNPAGDQGVSPTEPLKPNFDEAAADRLTAAKQAHADYAQTYKNGPAAARLKTNGFAGQYQMIDSGVPPTVFGPGAQGAEKVQSFLASSRNTPAARAAIENYAAMSLRRAAQRPDGSLDPQRFTTWARGHQDAIRAVPEMSARFGDVHRATQALQRFQPFTRDMAPSAIPEMFFHSGPSGGEGVANLRNVLGDRQTNAVLSDYAASKLRSQAMRPDGTFDPARVDQFVKTHKPALDALPGLADRFSTAARATEAVNQATLLRKTSIDSFQKDAVGKILGATDHQDIPRIVGGIFSSKTAGSQMRTLADKAAAAGPDAVQGLRRAVADHIEKSFISNAEAGTSGTNKIGANAFQTFVRKNAPILSHVFQPEEVANLHKMSNAITMMNRSREAVLVKGQSGTAQLTRMLKQAEPEHSSLLEKWFKISFATREAGEALEHVPVIGHVLEKAGLVGAVSVAAVKHIVGGMRAAGLEKSGDLVKEAMLHPEIGKLLLEKYTPQNANRITTSLSQKLLKLAPFTGAAMHGSPAPADAQQRAAGGRVTVPVAHITGEEIAPRAASTDDLRAAARDYYDRHLRGNSVFSQSLGQDVHFRKPKKSFSFSADPEKLRMFAALHHVIGKGDLVSSAPARDQAAEPSTKAYHYMEATVSTPHGHRTVGATLREDANGSLYYNHVIARGRSRLGAPEGTGNKAGPGDAGGGTAPRTNVAPDDDEINMDVRPHRAAGGRVEPTDAQKEAGNYPKDHIRAWGMNIAIENRKGTERRGVGKDGKAWSVKMPAHYGYLKGTEGADGDHVDCYLGPGMMARDAYIIDQNDLATGKFDEHKIMLGFRSPEDALQTYARGFSDGKGLDRAARITRIPSKDVFAWAKSSAARKPTRQAA